MDYTIEQARDRAEARLFQDGIIFQTTITFTPNRKGNGYTSKQHYDGSTHKDGEGVTCTYFNGRYRLNSFSDRDRIKNGRNGQPTASITLFDFYMKEKGITSFYQALVTLCQEYGIPLPDGYDEERAECWYRRQGEIEQVQELFRATLLGEEGAEARKYLQSSPTDEDEQERGRGYTDSDIQKGTYGAVTPTVWKQIEKMIAPDLFKAIAPPVRDRARTLITHPYGDRFIYRILYKRQPTEKVKNSYINPANDNSDPSGRGDLFDRFLGMNEIGFGREIVVVESPLDALHAQARGLHVVATCGNVSDGDKTTKTYKQISDSIRRGVRTFILLFDNDRAGNGLLGKYGKQDGNHEGKGFAECFIRTVRRVVADLTTEEGDRANEWARVRIYVAITPDCKDLDDYLAIHSTEELQALLDGADGADTYMMKLRAEKYSPYRTATGTYNLPDKKRDEAIEDSDELLDSCNGSNLTTIAKGLGVLTGLTPEELLHRKRVRDGERNSAQAVRIALNKAVADIHKLLANGDTDGALKRLETAQEETTRDSRREAQYLKELRIRTQAEEEAEQATYIEGLPLQYVIVKEKRKRDETKKGESKLGAYPPIVTPITFPMTDDRGDVIDVPHLDEDGNPLYTVKSFTHEELKEAEQEGRGVRLTLDMGLTFVCGATGHCKTTFLNNVVLDQARRIKERQDEERARGLHPDATTILYFSYEISRRKQVNNLLRLYVNDPYIKEAGRGNPIESYFRLPKSIGRDGKPRNSRDFNPNKFTPKGWGSDTQITHYDYFVLKKNEFFERYMDSGIIKVIDNKDGSHPVGSLLAEIKKQVDLGVRVALVCIDYAQLIGSESYSRQRTEEIKDIVREIKDFTTANSIPFLLAAQFNRQIYSPEDVGNNNIGEGGDFERIADTVLGLYNLNSLRTGRLSKDEQYRAISRLERFGLDFRIDGNERNKDLSPRKGLLYIQLTKRRGDTFNLDTLLEFEGRTGYIKPNYVPPEREEVEEWEEWEERENVEVYPTPPTASTPTLMEEDKEDSDRAETDDTPKTGDYTYTLPKDRSIPNHPTPTPTPTTGQDEEDEYRDILLEADRKHHNHTKAE